MNNYNMYNPYSNPYQLNQYAFVNGLEGAKSYPLAPNQTMMLMDSDNPVCYMKQANSVGQCSLKYFNLVEISEQELRAQLNKAVEPKPDINYATKEDLDSLNKRLDDILKKLSPKKENKE